MGHMGQVAQRGTHLDGNQRHLLSHSRVGCRRAQGRIGGCTKLRQGTLQHVVVGHDLAGGRAAEVAEGYGTDSTVVG